MPLLLVLSVAAFVSAFTIRMIDPLVPAIGRDLGVAVDTAALLATAYTFPYALAQPVLGTLADVVGKSLVIKVCLAALAVSLAFGAMAPTFETLFVARMCAGIAGGGIIPVAFALVGDRFSVADRQWALSRLVMAAQVAILFGTACGGLVATHIGWRPMFVFPAVVGAIVFVLALRSLPSQTGNPRQKVSLASIKGGYREALTGPWAIVCLTGVFLEGIAMSGLTPFIAARMEQRGIGTLTEAGLALGAMSIGGIGFTLLVRPLLAALGRAWLVRIGGILAALSLVGVAYSSSWQMEAACLFVNGFGFFMVHNSLQAMGTELAPNARGSGVAMFAFVFFMGQAIGPVAFRELFASIGPHLPVVLLGLIMLFVGLWFGRRLQVADAIEAR